MKKLSMTRLIEQADAAKKVNPLDLSSDQDLTVALMNLIVLEELSVNYPELYSMVRELRIELMSRVVRAAPGGKVWCISKHLLGAAMRLIDARNNDAYNRAYELYSLFWGLNMGLIDVPGVTKAAPDIVENALADTEYKKGLD